MKNIINRLKTNTVAKISVLVLAIAGISTGITWASIPDSGGVIHGCFSNRDGTLRIIDTDNGATCNVSKETALNWNQAGPRGGAVALYDTNGQNLGTIVDYTTLSAPVVYNSLLHKLVTLSLNSNTNQIDVGTPTGGVFQSTNCTGTVYINPPIMSETTLLYRLVTTGAYLVLNDNETPQNITVNSNLDGSGICSTYSYPATVVPLNNVSSPYSPIILPLKL